MSNVVETAFRRHWNDVYRFVRRRGLNHEAADGLTQQVFTDAAAALSRLVDADPSLAWLYTVARRRFVDELRRSGRGTVVPLEESAPAMEYGKPVTSRVPASFERLSNDQRELLALKLFRGARFTEICSRTAAIPHIEQALAEDAAPVWRLEGKGPPPRGFLDLDTYRISERPRWTGRRHLGRSYVVIESWDRDLVLETARRPLSAETGLSRPRYLRGGLTLDALRKPSSRRNCSPLPPIHHRGSSGGRWRSSFSWASSVAEASKKDLRPRLIVARH